MLCYIWLGQARFGQVRLGKVRLGLVWIGQVKLGQVDQVGLSKVVDIYHNDAKVHDVVDVLEVGELVLPDLNGLLDNVVGDEDDKDNLKVNQVSLGQVRLGQVRLGQVKFGCMQLGQFMSNVVSNNLKENQVLCSQARLVGNLTCLTHLTHPTHLIQLDKYTICDTVEAA